ncbi:transporter [Paraburkholderia terrae]|uniref:transporter n=1 Tax=Paraburkholderia terrae TaxID=311230 RepID=UPI003365883F
MQPDPESELSDFIQPAASQRHAGRSSDVDQLHDVVRTYPALHVSINGYFFKQLEDDRINGTSIADSREQVLGIGSGIFWQMSKTRAFWLNAYTETAVQNRSRNNLVLFAKIATSF